MPFIADPDAFRTYDPDTGIELKLLKSGPDPDHYFQLISSSGSYRFSALLDVKSDPPNSDSGSSTLIWLVSPFGRGPFQPLDGRSLAEVRQIISDALKAFRRLHGRGSSANIEIKFLSEKDVLRERK